MSQPAVTEHFSLRQKITMMVNRYEIRAVDAAGVEGPVIAVAQQKRMAFKEQVTFYSDEARTQPVFSFKARTRMDLGATYDVLDAAGNADRLVPQGLRQVAAALVVAPRHPRRAAGLRTERNQNIAILRRVWDLLPVVGDIPLPFIFHFDFNAPDGSLVLSSERKRSLRDRYDIHMPQASNGWQLDWRVGLGMAVALDALQSR